MLIMTAKLSKKKLICGIITAGLVICAVILLKGGFYGMNVAGSADVKTGAEVRIESIKTPEDRVRLLESYGWQIKAEPIEFMEVQIPEEFDDVYEKYNEIQLGQGMDLKKYAGKRAMRYSYQITNYPSGETDIIANILIYKNKLIGGDVCSPRINGFMHGLSKPE